MNAGIAVGYPCVGVRARWMVVALCLCLTATGCRSGRRPARETASVPRTVRTLRAEFPEQRTVQSPQPTEAAPDVPADTPADVSDEQNTEPDVADAAGPGDAPADEEIPVLLFDDPDVAAADSASPAPAAPPQNAAEALERLSELGATISRDYEGTLLRADLSFLRVDDSQVAMLVLLNGIRDLDLTGTDITDVGLEQVAQIPTLQSLRLKGTAVTDAGLDALVALPDLKLLDVGRTAVSDAGLKPIARIETLNYLLLHNTRVTDTGLKLLTSCRNLKGINLIGTQVTADGMEALRDELPECVVIAEEDLDVSSIRVPADMRLAAELDRQAPAMSRDPRFRRLLRLAGEQPEIAEHLAGVYAARGEWSRAAAILKVAEQAWPQSESIRYSLASALVHAGQVPAGLERFESLLGESDARYTVGVIVYVDALRRAERHLEVALQADASNEKTRTRLDEVRARLRAVEQASREPMLVASFSEPQIIPGTHEFRVPQRSAESAVASGPRRPLPGTRHVPPHAGSVRQPVQPVTWPGRASDDPQWPSPGWEAMPRR